MESLRASITRKKGKSFTFRTPFKHSCLGKTQINQPEFNKTLNSALCLKCRLNVQSSTDERTDFIKEELEIRYYSYPEKTVHSTLAKIYYVYHSAYLRSLIIIFGTFWDPNLQDQTPSYRIRAMHSSFQVQFKWK